MLQNEEDHLNCVIEINAGAGGTESCDWAQMLMRMYIMFAEKNGFKGKELDRQDGDVAGVKSVSLEIEGDFAFGRITFDGKGDFSASGIDGWYAIRSAFQEKKASVQGISKVLIAQCPVQLFAIARPMKVVSGILGYLGHRNRLCFCRKPHRLAYLRHGSDINFIQLSESDPLVVGTGYKIGGIAGIEDDVSFFGIEGKFLKCLRHGAKQKTTCREIEGFSISAELWFFPFCRDQRSLPTAGRNRI